MQVPGCDGDDAGEIGAPMKVVQSPAGDAGPGPPTQGADGGHPNLPGARGGLPAWPPPGVHRLLARLQFQLRNKVMGP